MRAYTYDFCGSEINNGGGEKGNSEEANSWYPVEDRPHWAWKKNKGAN